MVQGTISLSFMSWTCVFNRSAATLKNNYEKKHGIS